MDAGFLAIPRRVASSHVPKRQLKASNTLTISISPNGDNGCTVVISGKATSRPQVS